MTEFTNYETIRLSREESTVVVTLDRPEALNAANRTLHREISLVWSELANDSELRCVVLTGAGRAFCGGGDLGLLQEMTDDAALRRQVLDEALQLVRSLVSMPVPVVAAINGPAVGLGCSLASLCDLVVMDEDAYFADPHILLGLVAADGGVFTWPEVVGLHQVKELIFLGGRVSASDALRLGLANRVVPPGTCLDSALVLAKKLAALPPQAVRETKRILNAPLQRRIDSEVDDAIEAESQSFDNEDFRSNLTSALRRSAK